MTAQDTWMLTKLWGIGGEPYRHSNSSLNVVYGDGHANNRSSVGFPDNRWASDPFWGVWSDKTCDD